MVKKVEKKPATKSKPAPTKKVAAKKPAPSPKAKVSNSPKKAIVPTKENKAKAIPSKESKKKPSSESAIDSSNPLGKKFSCYNCGTKFYDLNKPNKLCPKCGSDQMAKPALRSRAQALKSNDYDVEDDAELPEEEFEAPDIIEEAEEDEREE